MNETNHSQAVLIGESGSFTGQRIPVIGPATLIGRDQEKCQVVIRQTTISRQHACLKIDSEGNGTITDLGSTYGTFVNGEQITQQQLRDGDRIGLGPSGLFIFTYRSHSRSNDAPQAGQTMTTASSLREQLVAAARVATAPHRAPVPAQSYAPEPVKSRLNELPVLRIGRAPDNEVVLEAPGVSRYHASLTYSGDGTATLTDLGSTNGTFVNGEPLLNPRVVGRGDLIILGGFILRVDGRNIFRQDLSASRISAVGVTKQIGGRTILREVSLAISPREFVGLIGPSGSGKSTLMDALNGLRPASSGSVYINELDLYQSFDSLRRSIGHVPQRDILHDALTVERTLYFAAKLRLPDSTPKSQLLAVVDEVINTVGLAEFRSNQFRQLSGGQQKRLSLGLELITKPSFIFLDEPTSPLDPETTENMMELFRRLADDGRIVVMVTHKFERFELMDHVAILTKNGQLAFFGPPSEALKYFGCREPAEIYRRIGTRDSDQVSRDFASSATCRQYVIDRIAASREAARSTGPLTTTPPDQRAAERRAGSRQWLTLTRRYLEIKLKDTRNTMLLFVQAPIIALILVVIAGNVLNAAMTLFIAAVISIWFGANNAVREIVSEASIYMRERLVNLKIPSYVLSKFTVLSGIALIQCTSFLAILIAFGRLSGGDFAVVLAILYLSSLAGIAMGLFCSALVSSTEKAMSILPLVLIPQLLLSGFFKPLDDLYVNARTGKPVTVQQYRQSSAAGGQAAANQLSRLPLNQSDPITRWTGMGPVQCATWVVIARWSVEGLVAAVSIDDRQARDKLAATMTVPEYDGVLAGKPEADVAVSYRARTSLDCLVLFGFVCLFLALSIWALKRKDAL